MKIENIIATLYSIAPAVDGFTTTDGFNNLIKSDDLKADLPLIKLAALIKELEHEQRFSSAKAAGRSNPMKVAEKVLKRGAGIKPCLGYATIVDDNQYICDSYICICYEKENHLPLPILPEDMKSQALNFPKLFDNKTGIEVELPDLKLLKNYIKVQKAINKENGKKNAKILYDFGTGTYPFNAELLAEAMEMLPNATAEIVSYSIKLKDESENKGIVMATKPSENYEHKKTEI